MLFVRCHDLPFSNQKITCNSVVMSLVTESVNQAQTEQEMVDIGFPNDRQIHVYEEIIPRNLASHTPRDVLLSRSSKRINDTLRRITVLSILLSIALLISISVF